MQCFGLQETHLANKNYKICVRIHAGGKPRNSNSRNYTFRVDFKFVTEHNNSSFHVQNWNANFMLSKVRFLVRLRVQNWLMHFCLHIVVFILVYIASDFVLGAFKLNRLYLEGGTRIKQCLFCGFLDQALGFIRCEILVFIYLLIKIFLCRFAFDVTQDKALIENNEIQLIFKLLSLLLKISLRLTRLECSR